MMKKVCEVATRREETLTLCKFVAAWVPAEKGECV